MKLSLMKGTKRTERLSHPMKTSQAFSGEPPLERPLGGVKSLSRAFRQKSDAQVESTWRGEEMFTRAVATPKRLPHPPPPLGAGWTQDGPA